jgi:hypothetical protein
MSQILTNNKWSEESVLHGAQKFILSACQKAFLDIIGSSSKTRMLLQSEWVSPAIIMVMHNGTIK